MPFEYKSGVQERGPGQSDNLGIVKDCFLGHINIQKEVGKQEGKLAKDTVKKQKKRPCAEELEYRMVPSKGK